MIDPLTLLVLIILAFITGAILSNLYSRIVATDKDEALEEASQLIADLLADNERLEAELEELRAMLDRLANARIGSEGDTDYGVRLAGEIDEGQ